MQHRVIFFLGNSACRHTEHKGYYALFHVEVGDSLFLDNEGGGGGETVLSRGLRYLDLAPFRIRSHPFGVSERISKVAPALTRLRLLMWMAGGLRGALRLRPDLGVGAGAASKQRMANSWLQKDKRLRPQIQPPLPIHLLSLNLTYPRPRNRPL